MNGNEEDTFLALKKPTYKQMQHIWTNSDLFNNWSSAGDAPTHNQLVEFFQRHSWGLDEYSYYHRQND